MAEFDFYFSFRSPYCYLAIAQLEPLMQAHDAAAVLRIVRPLAIRIPGFFERADPLRTPYMRRDAARCAEVAGLPYRWPRPDPVAIDDATGKVDADQPFIHRLSRLGAAACELGNGLAFAREVACVLWSGQTDGWQEGDHLAGACARAGLDWTTLSAAVEADPNRYDRIMDANEQAQRAAGHWGVPLFVFEGEPFFGQDRLPHLVHRLANRPSGS